MLTEKQRDLLLFVNDYIKANGTSPSFDEMRVALELKSKSGIHRLIGALVDRGFIEKQENKARALKVIKLPEDAAYQSKNNDDQKLSNLAKSNNDFDGEMVEIPMHGKIAAGTPIEAIRHEHDTIGVPMNFLGNNECYALTVDGDSMMNAGIRDGDVVVIERCQGANNGDIVVALVDGEEVTLKTFFHGVGQVTLQPENPEFEPIVLAPNRVQIQGKLKTLFRYY